MTLETIHDAAEQFDPLWQEVLKAIDEEIRPLLMTGAATYRQALALAAFRALEIGRDHWHCAFPREPLEPDGS